MMKRVTALAALCAVLSTGAFAQQAYIDLGGGNVNWNGTDPYIDLPFIVHIIPGDGTIPAWDFFAIRFNYNATLGDIAAYREAPGGGTFSQWFFSQGTDGTNGAFSTMRIRVNQTNPINGLAAGQIYSVVGSTVDFAIAVAAGAGTANPFRPDYVGTEADQKGVYATRNGPNNPANRVPLTLRLFPQTIGIGNTFTLTMTDQSLGYDNRRRLLGVVNNTWTIVPEPASMIALGSGLVGLLALRRRRSN